MRKTNKQDMNDKAGSHEMCVWGRALTPNGLASSICKWRHEDKKEPAKQRVRW